MYNFVEIRSIGKEFVAPDGGRNIVLKDINLEIKQGEFVSLIGHSGCGKSTLLNIVAGLETSTRGSVEVDGQLVRRPGLDRMVVFQNYSLLPWLTTWENIALAVNKAMPRKSRAERHQIIDAHLEMVGLKDAAAKKPGQLSGGMKQRVALARALAIKPKLLLLDEPFGALDALTRSSLQAELMRICDMSHITTIMVTHDVDEALLLSDRVVMMNNGPSATIGQILEIAFEHPRSLTDIVDYPEYQILRHQMLQFLYKQKHERQLETETAFTVHKGV
ncbi:ABC transporter ATP-binding protein [Nodularia sphaerocarpa]|uniref:ABC transporter ATP-binding protein n=1 Tax=Nodularia sphaerocarpa TaxID=137816 RepID=UPI001EFABE35|nr:nitrate ABC transporter ATP-binding protein [Nodularia sphaerocarpa]MDB9375780.1 nitrate ABC transporter ATP-binding protein [Nodularia sphaerocarpa CS-585]MDB9378133.1 nitrate ABC transporter ATP-binding protein [Nodularia sphaerocarpa CS-585A2]ULP71903.1 Bicarbonate transport ATP-binding protein CmpC [Nodularia sphaerocarpa UHCC 0038]